MRWPRKRSAEAPRLPLVIIVTPDTDGTWGAHEPITAMFSDNEDSATAAVCALLRSLDEFVRDIDSRPASRDLMDDANIVRRWFESVPSSSWLRNHGASEDAIAFAERHEAR
jgi:hypothetical protein